MHSEFNEDVNEELRQCPPPCGVAGSMSQPQPPEVVAVTGASGFVGSHLGRALKRMGHRVVGIDWALPDHFSTDELCDEFRLADLRTFDACVRALWGCRVVYHCAGDTTIHRTHHAHTPARSGCVMNNALVDLHVLEAARQLGVATLVLGSASPPGVHKVFSEYCARLYARDYGMQVRVARFRGVYGPRSAWKGGRENAPAALCRKVAASRDQLEIWGDGQQVRSYLFVDDLVEGLVRLAACDDPRVQAMPVTFGSTDAVTTIDALADLIMDVAHHPLPKLHVRGREGVHRAAVEDADLGLMRDVLGWEPPTSLRDGLVATYDWIFMNIVKDELAGTDTSLYDTSVVAVPEPHPPLGSS
jgi:nucleoside-diphosphate-sugar epimerase